MLRAIAKVDCVTVWERLKAVAGHFEVLLFCMNAMKSVKQYYMYLETSRRAPAASQRVFITYGC